MPIHGRSHLKALSPLHVFRRELMVAEARLGVRYNPCSSVHWQSVRSQFEQLLPQRLQSCQRQSEASREAAAVARQAKKARIATPLAAPLAHMTSESFARVAPHQQPLPIEGCLDGSNGALLASTGEVASTVALSTSCSLPVSAHDSGFPLSPSMATRFFSESAKGKRAHTF